MRQESDGLYFVFVFHKYHIAHRSLYSIELINDCTNWISKMVAVRNMVHV